MLQVKIVSGNSYQEVEREMNEWLVANDVICTDLQFAQSWNGGVRNVIYTAIVWYEKDE